MKTKLMALAAAIAVAFGAWADPEVTDITAKQRYPWNGLVDISCTVSGMEQASGEYKFVVVAVDKVSGKEYTVSHFSVQHGDADVAAGSALENGNYDLLWNAREDLGQVVFERMTMRITLETVLSGGRVQLWAGGPYWADRNIGASSPEDSGLYFWWGDTTGHRPSGTTFSFSFSASNTPTYSKSSPATLQSEGWVVSKNGTYVLAPAHDAAHVKWGGSWRMPTYQELADLTKKCYWMWTTRNGVKGLIVRGRGAYAVNSIFLPASGYGIGSSLYLSGSNGYYWSSVPNSDDYHHYHYSWYLNSRPGLTYGTNYYLGRPYGFPVRPVQGSTN